MKTARVLAELLACIVLALAVWTVVDAVQHWWATAPRRVR